MDERHSRTSIFLNEHISDPENFFSTPVTITGNNKLLESKNGQVMAESVINIVSRFSDKIILDLPESSLRSNLERLATDTGCNVVKPAEENPEIVLSIGNTNLKGKFTVSIDSDGWVSYVSCNSSLLVSESCIQNPIGAMGSACFASAEIFKRLLELNGCEKNWVSKHPENLKFSFLDNTFSDTNTDLPANTVLPKILLVGAGAVGSGFVYALTNITCKGNIKVIDDDIIDRTNLNRCLTYFEGDIGKSKSKIIERYSNKGLNINGDEIKFNELKKERKEFPIVVSTVDNNEARHEIQFDLPQIIFHGATGKHTAAVGVIKFLENACLGCIFESAKSYEEIIASETGIPVAIVKQAIENKENFSPEHFEYMKKHLDAESEKFKTSIGTSFEQVYKKEVCGKITIKTEKGQKSPSIPFVSFFSGLMLASELIKYSCPELQQFPMMIKPDFLEISLFSPQNYNTSRRTKNSNCPVECSEEYIQKVYSEKWRSHQLCH